MIFGDFANKTFNKTALYVLKYMYIYSLSEGAGKFFIKRYHFPLGGF